MDDGSHNEVFSAYQSQAMGIIRDNGWMIQAVVGGDSPSYCYTVGLPLSGKPELVMTGLSVETCAGLLGDAAERDDIIAGKLISGLIEDYDLYALEVTDSTKHLKKSNELFEPEDHGCVDAIQLVWPDADGNFPWDPNYQYGPTEQPLLGLI